MERRCNFDVQGWSGGIAYSAIDQDLRHDGAGATFPALTITGSSATQFTALKIRGFTTAIPFLDYEGKMHLLVLEFLLMMGKVLL